VVPVVAGLSGLLVVIGVAVFVAVRRRRSSALVPVVSAPTSVAAVVASDVDADAPARLLLAASGLLFGCCLAAAWLLLSYRCLVVDVIRVGSDHANLSMPSQLP
jgi:hypothetical protein